MRPGAFQAVLGAVTASTGSGRIARWIGPFKGKEKKPTVVLEAIVDG